MPKPVLLFAFCLLMVNTATAQPGFLKGYLIDSATHYPIKGATIKNSDSRKSVVTDGKGFFGIAALPNDMIYAIAFGYHYDTIRFSLMLSDTITIALAPAGTILPTITVQSSYSRYQLDSAERKAEYIAAKGPKVRPFSAPSTGFGIAFSLHKKDYKKAKLQKQNDWLFSLREEQAYVEFRYPPKLVATYTGLKGEELTAFIYLYTPTYEWLRQHPTNEAVLNYINEKLKLYKAVESTKK
ncbi:MAG: hypothetical protein JWP88_1055 [Flaviaesturariibacter sp.]|nr:hypothetical protein [Flaviaesturariibacter sp.]